MMQAHINDRELLLAADGELDARRAAQVREHLAACWTCRARMRHIEETIAGFVDAHQSSIHLPPAEGPRALLRARLAELAAAPGPRTPVFSGHRAMWTTAAAAVAAIALITVAVLQTGRFTPRLTPDPRLTPGATLTASSDDVCASQAQPQFIPASVGREVFARYGIGDPAPRAYELDYLIAPELGGAGDPRNFWPQPYAAAVWNAHVKDALEEHLHQLVCEQKVSLTTAQRDIADDWISAYKKYFETDQPIASHRGFTKDRPWEE